MKFIALALVLAVSFAAMGCATTGAAGSPTTTTPRPVPWPPESLADQWSIGQDGQGRTTLSCNWQYGVVDKVLTFVLREGALTPASGTNRYPNQHVRPMSPGEIKYYWEYGGARHAVEKHKGKAP